MLAKDRGTPTPLALYSSWIAAVELTARFFEYFADSLISHAKSSLLPLDSTLSRTQYLAGNNPSYVDYIAYGR